MQPPNEGTTVQGWLRTRTAHDGQTVEIVVIVGGTPGAQVPLTSDLYIDTMKDVEMMVRPIWAGPGPRAENNIGSWMGGSG